MSDAIKHECGIAFIRLRKPLQYYIDTYQTPLFGVNRLYLLMEKQHNRGQDGAGVANIKIQVPVGKRYISRYRSIEAQPLLDIFSKINKKFRKAYKVDKKRYYDAKWLQENYAFTGEVFLGHLRYGTFGENEIENCHPFLRQNNWRTRNLVLAGNFNMTNVDEQFNKLVELGQHPKEKIDTVTVMEKIGHFLDEENQRLFNELKEYHTNEEVSELIADKLDVARVLHRSARDFDGGYAMVGMVGSGAAFIARDPNGIRPAYYYVNDEVIVGASEKTAIKTAFHADYQAIQELPPGHALIVNRSGGYSVEKFTEPGVKKSCSFERIYFSRGSDPAIYNERKQLGRLLTPQVLQAIEGDLEHTVFSYIPNTAETAFLGLIQGIEEHLVTLRHRLIEENQVKGEELKKALSFRPRIEKLVIKDAKLRTFITDDRHRDEMVSHVYDTTYEVIAKEKDTLVVIDDSIVRGTTLEKSILTMLDRLQPRKIIIVSSAPQIRYPDCYGIDMSRLKDFIAFRAMMNLLERSGGHHELDEVYHRCVEGLATGEARKTNFVKQLYDHFTDDQISEEIARMIKPAHIRAEVAVVYQTVEALHKACPLNLGDWYFTGNYPTPGGYAVVNKAFLNFMEGKQVRAY
jgi:amidophosphoribosyltransferase